MKAVMQTWMYRHMTLMGRVLITNTLIGSLFVYRLQLLHKIPPQIITKINEANNDVRALAEYFTKCKDIRLVFKANLSMNDCQTLCPGNDFWCIMLQEWCRINYHEPQSGEVVESQVIWLNSLI